MQAVERSEHLASDLPHARRRERSLIQNIVQTAAMPFESQTRVTIEDKRLAQFDDLPAQVRFTAHESVNTSLVSRSTGITPTVNL